MSLGFCEACAKVAKVDASSSLACLGVLQLRLQRLRVGRDGLRLLLPRLVLGAVEPLQQAGAALVVLLVFVHHVFEVVAELVALKQRKTKITNQTCFIFRKLHRCEIYNYEMLARNHINNFVFFAKVPMMVFCHPDIYLWPVSEVLIKKKNPFFTSFVK